MTRDAPPAPAAAPPDAPPDARGPLAHRAQFAAFRAVLGLLRRMDWKRASRLGGVLGRVAYRPLGIRRRVVERQVAAAFPELDRADRTVAITLRGPDLIVTARKAHFVRVNWSALHLESAQRDYQLSLRVGNGFDHDALSAEISDGVLTITVPHKANGSVRHRRVA